MQLLRWQLQHRGRCRLLLQERHQGVGCARSEGGALLKTHSQQLRPQTTGGAHSWTGMIL